MAVYQRPTKPGAGDIVFGEIRIWAAQIMATADIVFSYRTPAEVTMSWDFNTNEWKASGQVNYDGQVSTWYVTRLVSNPTDWYLKLYDADGGLIASTSAVPWSNTKGGTDPYWAVFGDAQSNQYGKIDFDSLDVAFPGETGISGGGHVYVWSQDWYGTSAIGGGGAVTTFGMKGGTTTPVLVILESDDFNRADEMPILPPWTKYSGGANIELVSSAIRGRRIGSTDLVYYRSDALQHASAKAQFRTMLGGGIYPGHGILYRFNPSTGRGIRFLVLGWTNIQIQIAEYLPAFNYLGEITLTSPIAAGDLLEFQIIGTTLTVWKNGTVAATYDYPWSVTEAGIGGIAAYDVWDPSPVFLDDYLATAMPDHVGISGGGDVAATDEKGGVAQYRNLDTCLDDFNRADEDPLLPPWREATLSGWERLSLFGGRIRGYDASASNHGLAIYEGTPVLADCTVRFKIAAYDPGAFVFSLPLLFGRGYLSPDGQEWDVVALRIWKPASMIYLTRNYRIAPFAPDVQLIASQSDVPCADGDEWELEFAGTTITMRQNGIVRLTATDGISGRTNGYSGLGVTDLSVGVPVLFDDFQVLIESASSSAISGAGDLFATGSKDPRVDVALAGGGNVYASAREEAYRAFRLSGGGAVAAWITRGAKRGAPVSAGGSISVAVRGGWMEYAMLSAGGSIVCSGDGAFVDTASVSALIHGGGTLQATGIAARSGNGVIYGGGYITVRYDRNWPYLPEGTIPNPDNVCHLVKMEMDFCARTFGISPCLATGTPCYNTWRTCRYIQAYSPVTRTYRFISADFPQALPDARPYVSEVKYMPTEIKTNLTVNARVSFGMIDEPDADVDTDPYWAQRSSHPGTYWKRWLARNVNYKRRIVRIFEGVYGAAESTYVQKWVGKLENATLKGEKVTFEAVDLLKDLTKIEVPPKTNAKLALALAATTNPGQTFTITEDADRFPSSGYVRIDDEIIRYTSVNVATKTFTIGGSANRGLFGTAVAAHEAKAKVQITRYFSPRNPLEILLDMLLGDAGMKDSWVRDAAKSAQNGAAYTTAATYIDLNAAQTNSWPGTALMEIEGAGGTEFARYVSKTYVPATNVNRFVFDSYASVVTGRALFGSSLTSATAPSQVTVRLGAFEYVDTDAFYQYRDWPFRDIDFTSVVSEPTKLSDLFFEIVDLIDAKSWVAENLKITIRKNTVNTPTVGYLALSDADNIVDDSGSVDLNEKSRITRMSILWDKIVTGKASDDLSYRRLDLAIDPDAEENYAGPEEKVARCRWIDPYVTLEETVQAYVKNLAVRRIQRCKHAQNLVTVKVAEKDASIATGSYVRLSTDELLEADGNSISARMYQVVKRDKNRGVIALTLLQISPRRMAVIGPAGLPAYPAATETQKGYCYIADSYGRLSDGSEGYFIW